jgi:hypothetical protein
MTKDGDVDSYVRLPEGTYAAVIIPWEIFMLSQFWHDLPLQVCRICELTGPSDITVHDP